MKILLVVEPGIDGVFRHIESYTRFLWEKGHIVHLAYSSVRGCDALHAFVKKVSEQGGETLDLRVSNAPCLADLSAFFRLWRLAKKITPDVIHGHSSKAGVLTRALRLISMKEPIFYTPHGYYGMGTGNRISKFIFNFVETIFGKIGTTINISSDEFLFAQEKLGISQATIAHNPVNSDIFTPTDSEEKKQKREQLNITHNALVLGFMGRLSFGKDPQTLYHAIAPVMKQHSHLILYRVGKGELDQQLENLAADFGIKNRIIRQPYLNDPSIFYQIIDAMITTTRHEGFSLVVLESLSCNLPMIISEAPGMTDIRHAGLSHCWTAKVGDVEGFTCAIQNWIDDVPRQRPINHRSIAIERFSIEKCYGAVLNEYEKALHESSCS